MRRLALILIPFLTCCGTSGNSPPSQPATTPSQIHNEPFSITLDAARNYPGNISVPASSVASSQLTVTIPSTLAPQANASEDSRATLYFGTVTQCYYILTPPSNVYVFSGSCTGPYSPGQTVIVPQGASISLEIQDGYVDQTTRVEVIITAQ